MNQFIKKPIAFFKNLYWREILACLLLFIGIYFFRKERHQLTNIIPYLHQAQKGWLVLAAIITLLYILFQSGIYVTSFKAVQSKLRWIDAIELYLKRNLLGVFLPGGGIGALAYVPRKVKQSVDENIKIHQASGLFAFAGVVSTFIIGVPLLLLNLNAIHNSASSLIGVVLLFLIMASVIFLFMAIRRQGRVFTAISNRFPKLAASLHRFTDTALNKNALAGAVIFSLAVELCGIAHLYIVMLAVGVAPSLQAAALAYIVSILLMVASPFLKGIGAVELSIVLILGWFGYTPVQAIAIAFIYRLFEFWIPLFAGIIAFLLKGRQLFVRLFPALAIFTLGIINIVSVLTPPIAERRHLLKNFLPVQAIHASNMLIIYIGVALVVTAAFLVKGLRNAWWLAIGFTLFSIIGNLTKALDYEEAIFAAIVLASLVWTRRQYKIRSSRTLMNRALSIAVMSFLAALIYGTVGFYFLEKTHFGIDFSWHESITHTIRGFLLLQTSDLHPLTRIGRDFLNSIHIIGLLCWVFLLYALVRPYVQFHFTAPISAKERAEELLIQYGQSATDYFKTAPDKLLFFSEVTEGFVAYRIANNFAIALEEPVCALEDKEALLQEFEYHCHRLGLKTAFYRVDESSTLFFEGFKKKWMLIGQEGLVDVQAFSISGRSKQSLRNGLNSLHKKGFATQLVKAPHTDALLQELKEVSDEWLKAYDKKEMVFAQGQFDAEELQKQDLIITRNAEGAVVAFLNIIPNYAPNECTYDLIRKKEEAPGGCMDALIIELIHYAKASGFQFLNLGLAPMSGMEEPKNTAEQVVQYAYHKIKRFRQYQGLRSFKEKYASQWVNKYLVYENDFDLLQLPNALNKVMKPLAVKKAIV